MHLGLASWVDYHFPMGIPKNSTISRRAVMAALLCRARFTAQGFAGIPNDCVEHLTLYGAGPAAC